MGNVSYNDAIDCGCGIDRCEMCGAPVADHDIETKQTHARIEVVYRLAERVLWDGMTSKAAGTMLKIMCAATLLPSASTRQIGAAVGVSHTRVEHTIKWLKENLPAIHAALWRAG